MANPNGWESPKAIARAIRVAAKKLYRVRKLDPTTCEHDYTADELEFMRGVEAYQRRTGRKFPTWSEVLKILVTLGYRKPK